LAEEATETAERLSKERAAIELAREGEQERQAEAASRLTEANRLADELEAKIAALTEVIATTEARRGALDRQVRLAVERHERLDCQLESLDRQAQELKDKAVAPEDLAAAERAVEDSGERMENARVALEAAEEERGERAAKVEAAREALREIEGVVAKLEAEAGALRDMLLADAPAGLAPVLDLIKVEAGYENALGAALGEDLTAPVDSRAGDGEPRYWTDRAAAPGAGSAALPDGAMPLSQVVQGPAELTRRLSQIGVADDPATAARLQSSLAQGQRLTTREGGLWRWDGFVITVEAPSAAAVRMRQRNRLAEIEAALAGKSGDHTASRKRVEVEQTALTEIGEREKRHRADQRTAMGELDTARKQLGAMRGRLAELETKLAAIQENKLRIATDQAEAVEQRQQAEAELTELGDVEALRAESAGHRRVLAERRTALVDARAEHDRLVREAQGRGSRLAAIQAEQTTWSDRVERAKTRMIELEERQGAETAELQRLAARPAEIAEQRGKLVGAIEEAEVKRKTAADALASAEVVLGQADHASREATGWWPPRARPGSGPSPSLPR